MLQNITPLKSDADLLKAINESVDQATGEGSERIITPEQSRLKFAPLKAEPTPKEFLAQEAAIAQRQLAVVENNRARLVERYSVNSKHQKIIRAELAKLEADQKSITACIRANDRAAAIQRKAIFDLQEAGR
ncbi:hypothetical protein M8994_17355 [Brucella sp. 21LCYQ03]|nr:hypothetical protein [Brucella sp. 21LCYQ03]